MKRQDLSGLLARIVLEDSPFGGGHDFVRQAKSSLVDTIASCMAGAPSESVRALIPLVSENRDAIQHVLPGDTAGSSSAAALLDGTASHVLDYDDVTDAIRGHLSAVLWPTVLAVGREVRASGADIIDAYLSGYAAAVALAEFVDVDSCYRAGWHTTGIFGVIGGAGAAAKLYGCTESGVRMAIGIASSMASGGRANFGSMTKPFHVGLAAARGVVSATLASGGFTANAQEIGAPGGFLDRFYGLSHGRAQKTPELSKGSILANSAPRVKMHPVCGRAQTTAQASIEIHRELTDAEAQQIASIEVYVLDNALEALVHHDPQDGMQRRFSLEYISTKCITTGTLSLGDFDDGADGAVADSLRPLMRKVRLHPVPRTEWSGTRLDAEVKCTLNDGKTVLKSATGATTGYDAPGFASQLETKFKSCAKYGGADSATRLLDILRNFERIAAYDGLGNA